MYCLIDCNNFYASCEAVFNPKLRGKPFVVLSNNDGIIIARSQEARNMGIPMGAPIFKYRGIHAISSNFTLYGDMSDRVMEVIRSFEYPMEVYSIDETFLEVHEGFDGNLIKEKVQKWTGIATSVGIGPTKTLAKLANKCAKKGKPVDLATFPVEDIWGIGRRYAKLLHSHGIMSAKQLIDRSDSWIQKQLGILGLRTAMELRGTPCIDLEEVRAPRKGIVSSRTFGSGLTNLCDIQEAIASFSSIAAAKLRKENLLTRYVAVFIGDKSCHFHLPVATSSTKQIMNVAVDGAKTIFSEGDVYKRGGVTLSNFCSQEQLDLFSKANNDSELMVTIDSINRKYNKKAVYFGGEGNQKRWKPFQENKSPSYTTDWNGIPKVMK